MANLRRLMLIALAGTGVVLGARGCGGVTDDRIEARNRATKATCDRYNACGLIGTDQGDTYASYDSCDAIWKANWEMWWPSGECQGRISQAQLSECLSAIGGTDCANALDFLATLSKCSKEMICSGGTPADGGR